MRLIYLMVFCLFPGVSAASDALQRVADATFTLVSADGRDSFLGSGFVYGTPTRLVTNAHVVGRAKAVIAIAASGRRTRAQVIRRDERVDLAELRLDTAAPVGLTASGGVSLGAPIYAMGAPLEAGSTLTGGIVSNLGRQVDPVQPVRYVQHSAAVNPGSSGGPLVDARGAVVGMNTRIADGSRFFVGIAYAVPVDVMERFLAGQEFGPATSPGLRVRPLSPVMAQALGVDGDGVLVDHVAAGGSAHAAGIRAGDVLVALAGVRIMRPGDMAFALASAGSQVEARLLRANTSITLQIDLGQVVSSLETVGPAEVKPRTAYDLPSMGITAEQDGTITAMAQKGAGFFAGLSEGDRIVAINGVATTALAANWPSDLTVTAPAVVLIRLPDGSTRHFTLDPWARGKGLRPVSGANVMDQAVVGFE